MLHIFRKRQRPILWVILVVIIVTFVWFYGRGGKVFSQSRQAEQVGQIGTKIINQEDLNYAIRGVMIYLKLFLKYPPELMPNAEILKQEGWRRIIELNQAKKDGITVSKEEVRHAIEKIIFGGVGNFNPEVYEGIVHKIGGAMTPREFEDHIREELMIEKVKRYLSSSVIITDDDLKQAYDIDNTLIKLAYIPFYYKNYAKGQTVVSNEIEEFFYTNQEDFRVPQQVNLAYAVVKASPDKVVLEDEELQEYYDENKDQFAITNDVDSSEVSEFKSFEKVKSDIKKELTKQRALEAAYDKLEQLYFKMGDSLGNNLDKMTKEFHANAKKLNIPVVETGWVALEDQISGLSNSYEIIRSALSAKEGNVSDLIQLPDDCYLIYLVKDKRETYLPELTDKGVKELVKNEIIKRRSLTMARQAAEQLRQTLSKSKKSFVKAAESLGYKSEVTVPLDRNSGIQKIGCPAEIVSKLFAFPVNVSVVVPFASGYILACPIEYYEADNTLMYAEESKLKEKLFRQEAGMLINSWLMQGAKKLKVKDTGQQQ
ncbi:MAG: hypothetical protein DRI44_10115 [Chlamydiae bacterium]|nr:MAG: hypothetical protein DRI44_10115 [Chlamydiota bacterium]